MGCADQIGSKDLRRLGQPHAFPRRGGLNPPLGVNLFDGFGCGRRRDGRAVLDGRCHDEAHDFRAHEWAGGIVDGDEIRAGGALKAGAHRVLSLRTAFDDGDRATPGC